MSGNPYTFLLLLPSTCGKLLLSAAALTYVWKSLYICITFTQHLWKASTICSCFDLMSGNPDTFLLLLPSTYNSTIRSCFNSCLEILILFFITFTQHLWKASTICSCFDLVSGNPYTFLLLLPSTCGKLLLSAAALTYVWKSLYICITLPSTSGKLLQSAAALTQCLEILILFHYFYPAPLDSFYNLQVL